MRWHNARSGYAINSVQVAPAPRHTVTHAIFDAGYNSNSRFYEKSSEVLGMTPSSYRAGGTDTEIRFAIGECSLGSILVARSDRGICAIMLGDDPGKLVRDLQDKFPHAKPDWRRCDFEQLVAKSGRIYRSTGHWPGSAAGCARHRISAARVEGVAGNSRRARPQAMPTSRSVSVSRSGSGGGTGLRHKHIGVAIPCHRVVRNDGTPCLATAGGWNASASLLEREMKERQLR